MESLNNIEVFVLTAPMFAMGFFHFRKLYFHFEFVKFHDGKLAGVSLVDVFINPYIFFQVFYIFIPIFIKSERKKEAKELELETKVGKSVLAFWMFFVITILVGGLLMIYKSN